MTTQDPIAVVGVSLRFPGSSDPRAFWRTLAEQCSHIREIPPERWDNEALYDPNMRAAGKTYSRHAALLDGDLFAFDIGFFGTTAREAARLDVQQRLLLELAFEAFEDAGYPLERVRGTPVGVYLGIPPGDYGRMQLPRWELATAHTATGSLASIAANRISYQFDLRGPSMALDTACSASLVAVHQACQALDADEAYLALAGGVNIILSPDLSICFSRTGALSPSGQCRSFDAAADGYVRGEGGGMVLLKRLRDAQRDGDRIYAVILGSAVNQDGRTNGITAPNRFAQEQVILAALRRAGTDPGDVVFVEAHGTGTPLGDPLEATALAATYGQSRPSSRPLLLTAAKTNVGHLETAAGIVGLIKTCLCLRHGQIAPLADFHSINPYIDLAALNLAICTELTPIVTPATRPALAGVSAFGFGGTNAHVIVQQAPKDETTAALPELQSYPLVWSAQSRASLVAQLRETAAWLRRQEEPVPLYRMGYQLSRRRSRLKYLFEISVESVDQLRAALGAGFDPTGIDPKTSAEFDYAAYEAPAPLLDLPRYPWDRVRCLLDEEPRGDR
jgi:acyl transferase domain-containing protein